jgi:hypothetical protein
MMAVSISFKTAMRNAGKDTPIRIEYIEFKIDAKQ